LFVTIEQISIALVQSDKAASTAQSTEKVRRLSEWLRGFCTGLKKNSGIDPLALVQYSHTVLEKNLATMLDQEKKDSREKHYDHRPPSCLLIAPEPKRYGEYGNTFGIDISVL